MVSRESLQSGMTVRSIHGERLGYILALGEAEFCIEKGLFFKKGYFASYDDIEGIRDGEVILSHARDYLLNGERKGGERSHTTGQERVVKELRTVQIPRVDQEIEATPVAARPLPKEDGEAKQVRGQVSREGRVLRSSDGAPADAPVDDDAYAPTPVRPVKEGGALPQTPGPDGLWP